MKLNLKLLTISILACTVILNSCGEEPGQTNAWKDATVNSTKPVIATSNAVIDLNAKSDSKGIGKFTSIPLKEIDPVMASKGKTIFTAKCAACHQITSLKLVGPGLAGLTNRRTPEWIMNQITNPVVMAQKDAVGQALLAKYVVQMTNQNVTDEETRQILEYLRTNDKKN